MNTIFDAFKLYVAAQGPSQKDSNALPLLEMTARDYPSLEMLFRNRTPESMMAVGSSYKSKFKSRIDRNYDKRYPGTRVNFESRGSINFFESALAQEFGTAQWVEEQITTQSEGAWSDEDLAQKFDDIFENGLQDLYVDRAEHINETIWRAGTPEMETGDDNEPRSIPQGLNEWEAAHYSSGGGKRLFPGVTTIQGQNPALHGSAMHNEVETYRNIGEIDGTSKGHILTAFARGFRRVNFRPVPTAERYTQGTSGPLEVICSLEGCVMLSDVFAAHHHVIAEKGFDGNYMMATRLAGALVVDEPQLDEAQLYPQYSAPVGAADSAPDSASGALATLNTEMTATNAIGPRFYVPYQPHVLPVFQRDNMMRESPVYALEESAPDVLVMWTKNLRNIHFKSFRRGLVIRPGINITRYV